MSMRLAVKILLILGLTLNFAACTQVGDKLKELKDKGNGTEETIPTPTPEPEPAPEPAPDPTPDPTPEPAPEPTPEPIKHCVLNSLDDEVNPDCLEGSISLINKTLLAGSEKERRSARITASIKNGGKLGSKYFEHRMRFADDTNIQLPEKVPATGKAGNGEILYASFGNDIECAWFSKANKEYKDPKCFEGAVRDPSQKYGFKGGREVDEDEIPHAAYVQVRVEGASGNDALTTVEFDVSW